MAKKDVEKDIIRFGDCFLKKDLSGQWDFYRNYEDGDIIRQTYENFISVEVNGETVYVSKVINGVLEHAIYGTKGEEKVGFFQHAM